MDPTNYGKFLKRREYQNTTCLLRNLCTSQEATVRTRHGTVDWFQIEKEVHQGCIVAVRLVQKEKEWVGQSGKKRKFIRGKKVGDWLLRRTNILPFWQSPSYTPPMKNPLKRWSRSQRSGIWWSHSFEKTGTSETTGCHLGNLAILTDHCDLFFVCEVNITSHLINETPCGPCQ